MVIFHSYVSFTRGYLCIFSIMSNVLKNQRCPTMPEVPTPARTLKVATLPDTGGPLEHLSARAMAGPLQDVVRGLKTMVNNR